MGEYMEHLEHQLRDIEAGLGRAADRLKDGKRDDKAKALDELAHLRLRHDDLVKRMADARDQGADDWQSLHTSFQEELDGLRDTFEKWLTRFS